MRTACSMIVAGAADLDEGKENSPVPAAAAESGLFGAMAGICSPQTPGGRVWNACPFQQAYHAPVAIRDSDQAGAMCRRHGQCQPHPEKSGPRQRWSAGSQQKQAWTGDPTADSSCSGGVQDLKCPGKFVHCDCGLHLIVQLVIGLQGLEQA